MVARQGREFDCYRGDYLLTVRFSGIEWLFSDNLFYIMAPSLLSMKSIAKGASHVNTYHARGDAPCCSLQFRGFIYWILDNRVGHYKQNLLKSLYEEQSRAEKAQSALDWRTGCWRREVVGIPGD